jgi:hypothetical protein
VKDPILNLISSYENLISTLRDVTALHDTTTYDETLTPVDKEREKLKSRLQGILAKNCSLRRKDFNRMMERILSDIESKKEKLKREQKQIRGTLKEYLDEQKELATLLREKLTQFTQGNSDKDNLETVLASIKTTHEEKGQKVFRRLGSLKFRMELFEREQEEVNRGLQRLIDRGEALRTEDLRRLESAKAREQRRAETKLRREDVERLLSHFRQQRLK